MSRLVRARVKALKDIPPGLLCCAAMERKMGLDVGKELIVTGYEVWDSECPHCGHVELNSGYAEVQGPFGLMPMGMLDLEEGPMGSGV